MYEIVEIVGDDFKSVIVIDNLAMAREVIREISKQNPEKEYALLDEMGLEK